MFRAATLIGRGAAAALGAAAAVEPAHAEVLTRPMPQQQPEEEDAWIKISGNEELFAQITENEVQDAIEFIELQGGSTQREVLNMELTPEPEDELEVDGEIFGGPRNADAPGQVMEAAERKMTAASKESSQVYQRMVTSVIRDRKVQEAFLQNSEVQTILQEIRREQSFAPLSGSQPLALPSSDQVAGQSEEEDKYNKTKKGEGVPPFAFDTQLPFDTRLLEEVSGAIKGAGTQALEHIRKMIDGLRDFWDSFTKNNDASSETSQGTRNPTADGSASEEMFQRVIAIASLVLMIIVCRRFGVIRIPTRF